MIPTAVNLMDLSRSVRERHKHEVVARVNDSRLLVAVNEDNYPWHSHPNSDELFVVLEGELTVKFRNGESAVLKPHDSLLVPAGVVHMTIPRGRTVNLCFESTDIETVLFEGQE